MEKVSIAGINFNLFLGGAALQIIPSKKTIMYLVYLSLKWKSIIPYKSTGRLTVFGKADMRANKMTNNACFYLLDYGLYFSNPQRMK